MNIIGKICESGGKKTPTGRLINEDGLSIFEINYDGKMYNSYLETQRQLFPIKMEKF